MVTAVNMRPSRARRTFRRVLTLPLVALAALYFLLDDVFRSFVKPAVARLARLPVFAHLEAWIASLGPYPTLALFLVPMAVLWLLKLFALYLLGTGHVVMGAGTIVLAKVVGVGLAERLFAVSRDKLLSVPWFAWCYGRIVALRDYVYAWLRATWAWRVAAQAVRRMRVSFSRGREWARRALRRGGSRGVLGRSLAAGRRMAAQAGYAHRPEPGGS